MRLKLNKSISSKFLGHIFITLTERGFKAGARLELGFKKIRLDPPLAGNANYRKRFPESEEQKEGQSWIFSSHSIFGKKLKKSLSLILPTFVLFS